MRLRAKASIATLVLFLATSCSDVGPRPVATTEASAILRSRPADSDGRLRIGVLLPTTGPGKDLSPPLLRAIDLAVTQINAAGGVFDREVELVRVDEGADVASASASLEQLLREDPVDAVIGPASSRIALGLRDRFAANQMPTCSPLATASDLSSSADNGFFFRTIPSDLLQAVAMAGAIELTGGKTTSIVFADDAYGSSFNQALRTDLTRRGINLVSSIPYDTTARAYKDVAARMFNGNPTDSIAVIGAGESGARVLAALRSNGGSKTKVIVSDALRSVGSSSERPDANPLWLDGVQGVGPRARAGNDTWLKQFNDQANGVGDIYAAYAYDCVNLIALSAIAGNSESPAKLAINMISVSRSGVSCPSFASCKSQLGDKRNIDLVGASGPLDLTDGGDVSSGLFDNFTFDSEGRDRVVAQPITAP